MEVSSTMKAEEIFGSYDGLVEFNRPLAEFSTFKTGGNARYFTKVSKTEQLSALLKLADKNKIPIFVLGGGSNLLISDNGFEGLVIKIEFKGIGLINETELICGAGESLMDVVSFSRDNSLTGLEFASGIAGTIGGAVVGNAGAYGGEIKDVLDEITYVTRSGEIKTVTPGECEFSYRESSFKSDGNIISEIKLKLKEGDFETINSQVEEIVAIRKSKHPTEGCSAGSFFKNIPDPNEKYGKIPAGRLLEEVGAKNMEVGGAAVYEKHANIIINKNNASSKDIRELADILKKRVFDQFGIMLEEEVISVGDF